MTRDKAAFTEAVAIEKEVRKAKAGNSSVVARADLLRQDVWDRCRAGLGPGLAAPVTPLADAIIKLADDTDHRGGGESFVE